MPTTPTRAPTREQLLYWLHEAAEIEHHLMCCYLYASFSLKLVDPAWNDAERKAVARWRESIVSVVYEEMSHLALVGNLAAALGGTAHVSRPPFPVDAGPYPQGFVIRLQPFSAATIEHFQFLERPSHDARVDGAGFEPSASYARHVPEGRLSPGPRDYETVGELYEVLARSLEACAASAGEAALFIGDPARQLDATLAPLPGVAPVVDLASARQAIRTIVTQGEGAGGDAEDSHFARFCRIGRELAELTAANPSFEPAWIAATNPVMNVPVRSPEERVHISEPRIARWLDIGNALYTTSLRCLLQGFAASERGPKATWLKASFALMRAIVPVGQGLAARPAAAETPDVKAGLTFTPLRHLSRLPDDDAATFVAERLGQLRERAAELPLELVDGESAATWQGVIDALDAQRRALLALPGTRDLCAEAPAGGAGKGDEAQPGGAIKSGEAQAVGAAKADEAPPGGAAEADGSQPAGAKPAKAAEPAESVEAAQPAPAPETVAGKDITVTFDGARCIHSRHCVLDAPTVFRANVKGEWIQPDAMPAEAIAAVALSCPSGAIRFERHDDGPDERAPAVNQLKVRENGPYAVHAELTIAGQPDGFRATLCRCGLSGRKPWCDGSHAKGGFAATGEPATRQDEALETRGGALRVTPTRDGPLAVEGPLEICSGTGRTVARVTETALCRCGHSQNKPFCDNSHRGAGFRADGA